MTAFATFDDYLALPRVTALTLAPDGRRLIATIATLSEKGDEWVDALWELDPAGAAPARRLTRSAKGEKSAAVTADGSVLFLSRRDGEDDAPAALWLLPPTGEARRVLTRPGGVAGLVAPRAGGPVVLLGDTLPGSADDDADEKRRTARKDLKIRASLHAATPVRYWDADLGPGETRLFALSGLDDPHPVDLTPEPGRALDEAGVAVTPDGGTVVSTWAVLAEPGLPRTQLVALDSSDGRRRVLADDPQADLHSPAVSWDGRRTVCVREQQTSYDDPPRVSLLVVELATGEAREHVTDPDLWPGAPQFSPDGAAVYFTADEHGHHPIFRLELASGSLTRLTRSGAYDNLQVAADGTTLYALRSAIDSPPRPVRLDATAVDGEPIYLAAPGGIDLAGKLERVRATAEDGTAVEGWLSLPDGAGADAPAPLLLWVHGGPLGSWNAWSWRWNPWLMVARGYAVLQPDPALSTGYGAAMVQRGWGEWGGAPFTDLMTITDAVVERPDIDGSRTAALGGSYGGYMANWIAGHTNRFRCIVTHASLWALDQFQGTTDVPGYWVKEWGLPAERPERYQRWSPHNFLDAIDTPMLVIHGDKDYRVPIGEALRLWWDLQRQGVESRYLYFPDEGHWIVKPGNARLWYETVYAWLAQHVLGEPWQQPDLV